MSRLNELVVDEKNQAKNEAETLDFKKINPTQVTLMSFEIR